MTKREEIARAWINAEKETEFHRSQVQGFHNSNTGTHWVRDLTLEADNQMIMEISPRGIIDTPEMEYERCSEIISEFIEHYTTELIVDRLLSIYDITEKE